MDLTHATLRHLRALSPTELDETVSVVHAARQRAAHTVANAATAVITAHTAANPAAPAERLLDLVTPAHVLSSLAVGDASHIRILDTPVDGLPRVLTKLAATSQIEIIYDRPALTPHRQRTEIAPLRSAGVRARVLPELPMRLLLSNHRAFLAGDPNRLTSIGPGALHTAIDDVFRSLWRRAVDLTQAPSPNEHLLTLLAEGITDEEAAERLGVSPRTFYRRLRRLMIDTGTSTRFQLAVRAARFGWLDR